MKKIQITLTDAQHIILQQQMEESGFDTYSAFFRNIITQRTREDPLLRNIEHILKNTRETNRKVRIIEQLENHNNRKDKTHFIPLNVSKTDEYTEAEQAVKNELANLRETKLNKLEKR